MNLYNNKIIGIHKDANNKYNYNLGTLLNYPIKEFIQQNYYNNNKISLNNSINVHQYENKYNSELLKHLIRTIYLKQELCSKIYFPDISEGYLIKSEITNKLKEIYQLKKVIPFLEENQVLIGINYQNFNTNYEIISNYLKAYQSNYINSIQQLEVQGKIIFNKNEETFVLNNIKGEKNLIYIKNFEIIDKEFASFLIHKFNKNIYKYKYNSCPICDCRK